MFTERQKKEIQERLESIPNLGTRDDKRIELLELFDQLVGMADNKQRYIKESEFQEKLLGLEEYVTYLKGRFKI